MTAFRFRAEPKPSCVGCLVFDSIRSDQVPVVSDAGSEGFLGHAKTFRLYLIEVSLKVFDHSDEAVNSLNLPTGTEGYLMLH